MSYAPPPSAAPGQPGPPPGYYAPPPAPKRKKWPFVVGGIVLVMILGCVAAVALFSAGANEVAKGLDEADKNQKGTNAVAGKMNVPAKDGKFEFTVTKMRCGVNSVGPDGLGQKAQGQFCLVNVTIKNIAKSAELFTSSSTKAYDKAGAEYQVDSGAEMYANDQGQTFLQNINPGNTVKGVLIFDVPASTTLTSIVLHESTFTPGLKVPLA